MADRHDAHDLAAVVAFADGELTGTELEAVAAQVEACARLLADWWPICGPSRSPIGRWRRPPDRATSG